MTSPFLWREQRRQIEVDPNPMARKSPGKRGIRRPVEQLSMEGEVIRQFASLAEASRTIGQHESNICRVISGARKSCGGYRWRYVSREEQILSTAPHGGAFSKA